jgi:predicted transcriptional regulator
MQTNSPSTYLISVHPRWASAFFLSHNPKTIELRKGKFGASLKAGDSIAIYATMPVAEILGIVKVVKRELLTVDRLWRASQQGKLAKVSRAQFDSYYTNQELGIGVWVDAAELLLSSDRPPPTSAELGASLATTAADSATNRRSDGSAEHRPLNIDNITERYGVKDDLANKTS